MNILIVNGLSGEMQTVLAQITGKSGWRTYIACVLSDCI